MIRVSVISTKDIIKKAIKFLFLAFILVVIVNLAKISKKYFTMVFQSKNAISYITDEISVMGDYTSIKNFSSINPEHMLDSELMFSDILMEADDTHIGLEDEGENIIVQNDDNTQQVDLANSATQEVQSEQEIQDKQEQNHGMEDANCGEIIIQTVAENQQTEVIKSSYKQTYNCEIEGVKIKNESKYDINAMNLSSKNVKISSKDVIIFHTHTCESYTQTAQNSYVESGNYRTTDLGHSVARVGDVLQSYLNSFGFNVVHDKTYHDYPAYNGSYGRSLKTVSSLLQKNPKTQIIIDLHRDAMSDETYAPKVKIGDEYVSQIMFVIGTDGSGLKHDNWKKNLEFAIKVQKIGNEMYPGLFKPIILRNARYNQHLSSCATIIEFGATGNTLEECENAAKYLAKVLEKVE